MSTNPAVETHPVQNPSRIRREKSRCPKVVTMAAYEVYCELYGKQEAIITGGCRGGFGLSELIGFLYARSFPREQWRARVQEAWDGMENL